jgi:hypothetical protein
MALRTLPEHCRNVAMKLKMVDTLTQLQRHDFFNMIHDFQRLCNPRR